MRLALEKAKPVARIILPTRFSGNSFGTGFMVAPGLLMTNHHVLNTKRKAANCIVEFNFEEDYSILPRPTERFRLNPERFFITSSRDELDYTLVAIEQKSSTGTSLSKFGYIPMIKETGKVIKGHCLTIIQHPDGKAKKIAFRENYLIKKTPKYLIYKTDTAPGSSGSPVFNDFWQLVALHHAGSPVRDEDGDILTKKCEKWKEWMGEDKIWWKGNEGIRISRIIADLEKQLPRLSPGQKNLLQLALNQSTLATRVNIDTLNSRSSQIVSHVPIELSNQYQFEVELNLNIGLQKLAIREIKSTYNAIVEPLFPGLKNKPKNRTLKRFYKIVIASSENPWDLARQLEKVEGVEQADPILITSGMENPNKNAFSPNESLVAEEEYNRATIENEFPGISPAWNHDNTNFPEAIKFSKEARRLNGHTGIRVAQIDTGYSNHPEIDLVKKEEGFDYLGLDDDATDDRIEGFLKQPGHGTRTGGVLVGIQTNIPTDLNHGVFPYIDLIPYRVANSVIILGTANNVNQAVLNAVNSDNCSVIAMSMGSYGRRSWKELAKYVYDQGVIWVCAAGNEIRKLFMVARPAKYAGTIAVAATNYQDKPWYHSSRGNAVDISAPGENVYVPINRKNGEFGYNYGSGTSYAVPHVAAAAALWLNHHKDEIRKTVYTALAESRSLQDFT